MGYFIMGMQLLLSLSILITLHEMGHFLPARWFGMRVEKFYLFFNPKFALFKRKIGETEYGIGWLPLGGYVKITGMMDESMDMEALKKGPDERDFRTKPAWQRLIVMLGGVTVNFALGIFLLSMVAWIYGDSILTNENLTYGVSASPLASEMGFKDGDKILRIGKEEMKEFNPGLVTKYMLLDKQYEVTVSRGGQPVTFSVQDSSVLKMPAYSKRKKSLLQVRIPFVVARVVPGTGADSAQLQPADSIVAVNGQPTPFYVDYQNAIRDLKDTMVNLSYYRAGALQTTPIKTGKNATIGVYAHGFDRFLKTERRRYSLGESFPIALRRSYDLIASQMKAFSQMFTGRLKPTESMGGVISIGKMFPTVWDWEYFWRMTGALSLILAFMNLLPIPALDGGHVLFILYEIIARRPANERFMEVAQLAGILLLIGLILFANGNDIYDLFFPPK
ncbi:MAG: RIP metalloprotease RseP [Aureispira sp.]